MLKGSQEDLDKESWENRDNIRWIFVYKNGEDYNYVMKKKTKDSDFFRKLPRFTVEPLTGLEIRKPEAHVEDDSYVFFTGIDTIDNSKIYHFRLGPFNSKYDMNFYTYKKPEFETWINSLLEDSEAVNPRENDSKQTDKETVQRLYRACFEKSDQNTQKKLNLYKLYPAPDYLMWGISRMWGRSR